MLGGGANSGIYLFFDSLISLLAVPQGYGEEGLYTEQEGISSAPMFGPGIVGECHLTDLVIKVGRTDRFIIWIYLYERQKLLDGTVSVETHLPLLAKLYYCLGSSE